MAGFSEYVNVLSGSRNLQPDDNYQKFKEDILCPYNSYNFKAFWSCYFSNSYYLHCFHCDS
jgi:hypothetical protein